nr:hypothetical protein [Tanacetum cinerariifolium]
MFLYVDQLQNLLDKDEFQEDKSMAAFWVLNNQFQKFIDWQYFLDYDSEMTKKFFVEYTGIKVKQFRETPLLHMGNVKKSVAERTRHKKQYDKRMNERQKDAVKRDLGLALHRKMASLDNTSGLAPQRKESLEAKPHLMTPETINSGIMQNIPSLTPAVPPTKNDWDSLFQPMFDEYFIPPPNVNHPVLASVPAALTSLPSSTTVDQDAPSRSTSQTTSKQQSLVIPQGVEDDFHNIEVVHMDNDPYFGMDYFISMHHRNNV